MVGKFFSLLLLLCWFPFYSQAVDCNTDTVGLCTPTIEQIIEESSIETIEYESNGYTITTETTTTTTTTTVSNEDSNDLLDGDNDYVVSSKEGDMDIDWGGQGPASMPSGNTCGQLGTDKCAQITGSGNSTSSMGVTGMGTTFINSVDISDLNMERGGEVRYTIEVDKRDAQDRIYMHITGRNGKTNVFQGTDILSETGVASGYQSYNGSFDFSGTISTVIIEVGGRDINLAIGPLFDDVTVNVLYNVVSTLIEQEITTLEQIYYLNIFDPTELDFVEEVFEFNDISVDDGEINFTPIEPEPEEITFASVELEIAEFELELPEPEVEIVEVETEIELEIEIEIEEIEVVEAEPEEETIEESQEELQEPEQETPQTVQKEEDQEEKIEEEKPSKPKLSNKEKAATKIVKKIDDKARYDESNQMKTLIVMQILGDTKAFFDAQSVIQDTNVEEYLLKTLEDKYGILFNNSQNNTMERMINGQY